MIKEETKYMLALKALEARKKAYAPYSRFLVGAALLCPDGSVYTGCNVENASYPCGICAERTAAAKAVSEGRRVFTAVAVAGFRDDTDNCQKCTPCGMCRQFLNEFSPDMTVLCCDKNADFDEYSLSDMLMSAF